MSMLYACRFLTCSTPCIHFCSYSPHSLSQLSPLKPPAQLHMQVLSSRVPPFWHTLLQTARINMYLSIGVSFSLTHNCQDTLYKQLLTVGWHTVNYKMHRGYNTCISNCLTSNLVHKLTHMHASSIRLVRWQSACFQNEEPLYSLPSGTMNVIILSGLCAGK